MDNIKKVSLKEEGIEEMNASSMILVLWKCEKNYLGNEKIFIWKEKLFVIYMKIQRNKRKEI